MKSRSDQAADGIRSWLDKPMLTDFARPRRPHTIRYILSQFIEENTMSENPSGAPPETSTSLDFVNQAEIALFSLADPVKFVRLEADIEKVRSGEKILMDRVDDIDAYIDNL